MTAQERYRIALNILSRVGIDGDLQGEFAKAMATLHGFESMNDMAPPPMDATMPREGMEQPMGQEPMQEQAEPQTGRYDNI